MFPKCSRGHSYATLKGALTHARWHLPAHIFVNGIIEEPLRLDVFAFDGGYRTSKDGYTHWKEYDFEIYDSTTNKNVVDGKITCGAAGTVEDPFSRYDVTIT